MSNSIWKTPDVKPDADKQICVKNKFNHIIYFGTSATAAPGKEWAYADDLVAAAVCAEQWERFADDAKKHIDGLNNMIDSWCKLILGDLPSKHSVLKEAITTYCYERRQKSTNKGE